MTPPMTAEQIAAELTAHEIDVIRGDPENLCGAIAELLDLCMLGLAVCMDKGIALSELGLAVRAIVTKATPDA